MPGYLVNTIRRRLSTAQWLLVFVLFTNIPPVLAVPASKDTLPPASNVAKVSATPDSAHLAKRILPAIRKTIDRYPAFYVFIFIGGFIIIAVIRLIEPPYLVNLLAASLNLKLLLNLSKEGLFGFNITNLLLDVLCVLMFSIGIQVLFYTAHPQYFLWILAFTAIVYFLKLILIQFLANIFMGRGEALIHLLMQMLFARIAALVLLPVLFVALYQPLADVHAVLLMVAKFLFALYIIWVVRLYTKMKSMSVSGMLYLFLYLCTIEMSPLAILLKDFIL